MAEPFVVTFVGGPWDGETRALAEPTYRIEVPIFDRRSVADDSAVVAPRVGAYQRVRTRFGDPYRFEWREPGSFT